MNDIYVVLSGDYDGYHINGYFTNRNNAEKCKEYELKRVKNRHYGDWTHVIQTSCLDDIDFEMKILELEEDERQKEREKEERFRQKELAELKRLKEKYEKQKETDMNFKSILKMDGVINKEK